MTFQRLRAEDAPALTLIEDAASQTHWTEEQFRRESAMEASRFFVWRDAEEIVGYGGYWKAADEAQLSNIVVRPERQRHGVGRNILEELLQQARHEGCKRCVLEVRAQNAAALALYKAFGFGLVGRRKRFYNEPEDDAILMEKAL